jgi:hypothetical protein
MGGTNIYQPLAAVFKQAVKLPRSIFLLTDGGVSSPEAVINLCAQNIRNTRVHAFGIGSGVSRELVSKCAERGKGVAEFVSEGENI